MAIQSEVIHKPLGLRVRIDVVRWLVKDQRENANSLSIGMLDDGHLLVRLEDTTCDSAMCIYEYESFAKLVKGEACPHHWCQYSNAVIRKVARELGIREFEGHDVDTWFADPEDGLA